MDSSIRVSEIPPSTPSRTPTPPSGVGIAVPGSPRLGHGATRRSAGNHRQMAKLAKRATAKKAKKDTASSTPSQSEEHEDSSQ
eukprot:6124576-Heterocapsa_arctica.AAC.1